MSFPAAPEYGEDDSELFVVQDPSLRARVLPLFSFDPRHLQDRPIGHGTTFRIDPWGGCATAFHVVEDLLKISAAAIRLRDDIRLCALEMEGIAFGLGPQPEDSWRPIQGLFSLCGTLSPPMAEPRVWNATEIAALQIPRSDKRLGPTKYFDLDMRRWRPRVGDRVMALGFADLDDSVDRDEDRPIQQHLYGSEGTIIEVQAPDPTSSRPWPIFRVEANWSGGMSGGPVFNETGHVVGIVSTGLVGGGIGTAVSFAGWDVAERTFPTLDGSNPGRLMCWLALNADGEIVAAAPTRPAVEGMVAGKTGISFCFASLDPERKEFVSSD